MARRHVVALGLAACLAWSGAASAQQEKTYVVEGPGRTDCAALVAAEQGGEARTMTAAWLAGYVTAHNRLVPELFDLTPWQSPALLLGLVDQFCAANPDAPVEQGAQALVNWLLPSALTDPAEVVSVERDGAVVPIYAPVVAQVGAALEAAGHPPADAGLAALTDALAAWQEAEGLEVTGLPDQGSLLLLLQ